MREFIKIHPEDSVAVALKVLEKGTEVQEEKEESLEKHPWSLCGRGGILPGFTHHPPILQI